MQIVILVPGLNNLETRPQERSSRAQCVQISSIDMGLDYDSTVMLTCKLLFAAAISLSVWICPATNKLYLLDFLFLQDQRGGEHVPPHPPLSSLPCFPAFCHCAILMLLIACKYMYRMT